MKRLATATVVLAVFAAGAQAGSLPKPIKMTRYMKVYSSTHYIRGDGGGGSWGSGGGGQSTTTEEARRSAPAQTPATQEAPAAKPTPNAQPVRAD